MQWNPPQGARRTRWRVCPNLHQNGVFGLRAAGVDIERLLQTVAVELQSGGLRVYGGRQARPGVQSEAAIGGIEALRQQQSFAAGAGDTFKAIEARTPDGLYTSLPVTMQQRRVSYVSGMSGQSSGISAGGLVHGSSTNAVWNQSSRRFACSVTIS